MEEINLYDLMRFYAQKWLTILIVVMIGGIIGVGYTYYIQQPQYKSEATLLLLNTGRTTANQESVVINNYVELFKSRRVLNPVIEAEQYTSGYSALAASTTAVNVKNTDIINVSISTNDAKKSRALLESAINEFKDESKQLYGDNSVKISVVDAADTPSESFNKQPVKQIGLAVIAALAIAIIALFFVYDYRSQKKPEVKTSDAAEPATPKKAVKKQPAKKAATETAKKPTTKKKSATKKK